MSGRCAWERSEGSGQIADLPAIFIGIALATFADVWFGVSPTLAVAVGAAAGVTAATRLLITSVLFAALLVGTGGIDAVPAAVLDASAAWLTMQAVDRRSTGRYGLQRVGAKPAASDLEQRRR